MVHKMFSRRWILAMSLILASIVSLSFAQVYAQEGTDERRGSAEQRLQEIQQQAETRQAEREAARDAAESARTEAQEDRLQGRIDACEARKDAIADRRSELQQKAREIKAKVDGAHQRVDSFVADNQIDDENVGTLSFQADQAQADVASAVEAVQETRGDIDCSDPDSVQQAVEVTKLAVQELKQEFREYVEAVRSYIEAVKAVGGSSNEQS